MVTDDWGGVLVTEKPKATDDWGGVLLDSDPKRNDPGQQPSRTFAGTARDIAVTGTKGVVGAGEAIVGLANIPTLGLAGKAAERVVDLRSIQQGLDEQYSPAQQWANKEVSDAEGFGGTIKAAVKNPSTIAKFVGESLPTMVVGGGIGGIAKTVLPKIGAIAGGALGEGVISTGSAAESIRQSNESGTLTPGQAAMAVASGAGTGIFGVVGGRLANKFGFEDADTYLARMFSGDKTKKAVKGGVAAVAGRVIGGGISEGVFEELPQSMQEQIWQNAATGKPLLEGVPEAGATGLLAGAAMGGGFNLLPGQKEQPPVAPAPAEVYGYHSTVNPAPPSGPLGKVLEAGGIDAGINPLATDVAPELAELDRKIANLETTAKASPVAAANLEALKAQRDEPTAETAAQDAKFQENRKRIEAENEALRQLYQPAAKTTTDYNKVLAGLEAAIPKESQRTKVDEEVGDEALGEFAPNWFRPSGIAAFDAKHGTSHADTVKTFDIMAATRRLVSGKPTVGRHKAALAYINDYAAKEHGANLGEGGISTEPVGSPGEGGGATAQDVEARGASANTLKDAGSPDNALAQFEASIPAEDQALMADVFENIRKAESHKGNGYPQQLFNLVTGVYEKRTGKKLPSKRNETQTPDAETEGRAQTIEPHGQGIIVKGDKAQVRAKLAAAGVKPIGLPNAKKGGLVFTEKQAGAVRAALDEKTTNAPPDLSTENDKTADKQADISGSLEAQNAPVPETQAALSSESDTQRFIPENVAAIRAMDEDVNGLVRTRTTRGKIAYINKAEYLDIADNNRERNVLRLYDKKGDRIDNGIHVSNIDPTGLAQQQMNKDFWGTPDLWYRATEKGDFPFTTLPAAKREISKHGWQDSHEAVPSAELFPGMDGYLIRRKPAQKETPNAQTDKMVPATPVPKTGEVTQADQAGREGLAGGVSEAVAGGVKAPLNIKSDIPNEEWLERKKKYAAESGNNEFGVPHSFGVVTGSIRGGIPVVPVDVLASLKGERGEQQNVRDADLSRLKKTMQDTGKLPVDSYGRENRPYIEVDQNGNAWVSEGNHRIMAAKALGWKSLPIEIKYFNGGERIDGPLHPDKLQAMTAEHSAPQTKSQESALVSSDKTVTPKSAGGVDLGPLYRDWIAKDDYRISASPSEETLTKYRQWAEGILAGKSPLSKPEDFKRFMRLREYGKKFGIDLRATYTAFNNGQDITPGGGLKTIADREESAHANKTPETFTGATGNVKKTGESENKAGKPADLIIKSLETGKETVLTGEKLAENSAKVRGEKNTLFTDDMYQAARERMRARLNRPNAGLDPEMVQDGIIMAGFHIEQGARTFTAYAKAMIADMGDMVKPYLKSWYMAAKFDPRLAGVDGLSGAAEVEAADVDKIMADEAADKTVVPPKAATDKSTGVTREAFTAQLERKGTATDANGTTFSIQSMREGQYYIRWEKNGVRQEHGPGYPATWGIARAREEAADRAKFESAAVKADEPAVKKQVDASSAIADNKEKEGDNDQIRGNDERLPEGQRPEKTQRPAPLGGSDEVLRTESDGGKEKGGGLGTKRNDGLRGGRDSQVGDVQPVDFRITGKLGQGGPKAKFRGNLDAIKLVGEIGNRHATQEEQAALAKYVGWGGIPQAFYRPDGSVAAGWEEEARELKALLSKEDYEAARSTTQDAHYTSTVIIGGIYKGLARLGFTGGKILEPSVGAGNFIGLMPAGIKNKSKITAVEIDKTTAAIAKLLYPQQTVVHSGFQDFTITPESFDLGLGNPPFGSKTLFDPNHPTFKTFSIHNYFFAKTLLALREDGLLAMVVSSSMMDKHGGAQRLWLAERADLLGAIRLPNNAFKGNAGTEVTTDIIFLKKRAKGSARAGQSWQSLREVPGTDGVRYNVNEYFAAHPEMMLGDVAPNKLFPAEIKYGVYDAVPGLIAREGENIEDMLAKAIERLPEKIYQKGKIAEVEKSNIIVSDPGFARPYGYTIDDKGQAVRRRPDVNGERVFEPVLYAGKPINGKRLERFTGMMRLRDTVRRLIRAELDDSGNMETLRRQLNGAYDKFVAEFGYISETANSQILNDDPTDFPLLRSLEVKFDKGLSPMVARKTGEKARKASAKKAAIFTVRTRQPYRVATSAADAKEALAVVLREDGAVDLGRIAALYGATEEVAAEELGEMIFLDSVTGVWETADAFLSGNVKKKLQQAKETGNDKNAAALEKVQPADVPPEKIQFKIGAAWMPGKYYEGFAADVLGQPMSVQHHSKAGVWSIQHHNGSASQYDTARMSASDIFGRLLEVKDIAVYDQDADKKRILNKDETSVAQSKAAEIERAFHDWMLADMDRAMGMAKVFNDKVNTNVEPKFDGGHMIFPGMGVISADKTRDDQLREHQKNVVWRMIQKGKGLFDHVVGSGKTYAAIATGMELRRMGLVKKPVYVVPNHLVPQWSVDFQKLYPGANVLTIGKADFAKAKRMEFMGRIATGDWDAVLMAHSSFGFIKSPSDYEVMFYQDQITQYDEAIEAMRTAEGKSSRSVKQAEKSRDRLKEKLKAMADKPKDDVVDFSELGVDAIFTDEAHEFKNLFYVTKRTRVSGLGDPQGSKKAFDMFVKTQYLLEKNNGRGVFFLTGTPVSNTIAEMYTMMRYLDYGRMQDMGIKHFDQWAGMFADVSSDWEVDPTGTRYRLQSSFRGFVNIPGMMGIYKDFTDVISQKNLVDMATARGEIWPVPGVKGGKPELVVATRSDLQASFMQWIIHRMDHMPKDPKEDNPLKATGEAMKGSLDIRLINESLPDYAGSKVNLAVGNILDTYKEWNDRKGTQLVFCDLSVPKKAAGKQKQAIAEDRAEVARLEQLLDSGIQGEKLEAVEEEHEKAVAKMEKYSYADLIAADSNFSVYDDVKAKLLAGGIPASEVAFIHDANTDAQKEELFGKVRSGQIRVLMGSTMKMGAGMNVQDKLVALHHLDAPWRPSDLEQREGRIIRQGNEFFEESLRTGKKFEVGIYRYATKESLDTRRWQVIERKAKVVEQLRSGGQAWGEMIEDAAGEAANAAEMKAAASGNPLILDEIKLRKEIDKIEAQKRGWQSQRFNQERSIRQAASFNDNYEVRLKDIEKDVALIKKHENDPWQVEVNGEVFAPKLVSVPEATGENKKEVAAAEEKNQKAMEKTKKKLSTALYEGITEKDLSVKFKGVTFDLDSNSFSYWLSPSLDSVNTYAEMGVMHRSEIYYTNKDDFSATGLVTRMGNMLNLVGREGEIVRAKLADKKSRLAKSAETATAELAKGFDSDERLVTARAEHAAVLGQLQAEGQTGKDAEAQDFSMWTEEATIETANGVDLMTALEGRGLDNQIGNDDNNLVREEVGAYERRTETLTKEQQNNQEAAERGAAGYMRGLPGTVLGNRIAKSFKDHSKTSLLGQRVASLDDLAIIGQIFRNPSFETNRYVFVKDGRVVNITGVTSRLPGSSAVFAGGATLLDGVDQIQKMGERSGADGFYMLHNHPSGNPAPSAQDKEATLAIAAELPDLFLGHVVINHDSYATIHGFDVQVKGLPKSVTTLSGRYGKSEPSIPHPILGMKINGVDHLASVAAQLQATKETFQIVGTSGGESLVTGVMDVPVEKVNALSKIRLAGMLRKFARATGSARLFAVNVPDNSGMDFSTAIRTDLLHDVHMQSGESFANWGVRPERGMLSGRKGLAGHLVHEDSAGYTGSPASLENLEEVGKTMGSITVKKRSKTDSTFIDRIFSTPEYYFKKFAAAGRVLQAALLRRDVRFTKEQEILGKDFVGHVQALRKNNREAYDEANDYLIDHDQTGEGFSLKEEDETWKVIGPDGKMVSRHDTEQEAVAAMVEAEAVQLAKNGYSADAIQAVRLARELTNRGFDVMAADMRKIIAEAKEAGLPNPMVGDGTIDESGRYGIYGAHSKKPVALFATEQQANEAMARAAQMISYVVQIKGGGERSFMSEIKANAWAKKHSGTVNGRKTFDGLTVRMRTDVEMRPLTVQQALAQMGDMRGTYFPRIRKPGEYVLIAKKDGENPIRKSFDLPMVGDDKPKLQKFIGGGPKWASVPMAREARRLKARGYDVTMGYDESPVDDVFSGTNLTTAIDAILQDSMAVIDKNSQGDIKAGQQINQLITMQVADIFKARGYLSSRLKRMSGDVVWEGYETDMGKALTQYGKGIAAGTAKRDTAMAMVLAFSGRDYSWDDYKQEVDKPVWSDYQEIVEQRRIDPRRQKNLFVDVRAFMIDVLRNEEQADRIIGTMKGLAVLKFLGFRVSSAVVNATNMVTGVPATMAGHLGISLAKANQLVLRAASTYGKYRSGHGEVSDADRAIFQHITDMGWDDAQFNTEAARELRSEMGEAWNKVMTASMYMFGAVEKANRAMTIFAAYKAAQEQHPGASEPILWEKAKAVSDNAHGTYGKETLPAWARGKNNPLRLPYTFSKFSHNYMLNFIDLGFTRREYKAAAYLLVSPAILAGAGATLLTPLIAGIVGAAGGGDDPEEAFYSWAEETFGTDAFVRHGLTGGLLGINLLGSLQMNNPMPSRLSEVGGAPGAIVTDTWKAAKHFKKGEIFKGAEALLPTAFGSGFKAAREATEGVTTGNYGQVWYGDEPLKADNLDAALRFFSFNPSRLSGIREKQWHEKQVKAKYQERRTEINNRIKREHLQGKGITPEARKEIARYNELARGSGREDIKPITMRSVHVMLRRNSRADKFERNRIVNE